MRPREVSARGPGDVVADSRELVACLALGQLWVCSGSLSQVMTSALGGSVERAAEQGQQGVLTCSRTLHQVHEIGGHRERARHRPCLAAGDRPGPVASLHRVLSLEDTCTTRRTIGRSGPLKVLGPGDLVRQRGGEPLGEQGSARTVGTQVFQRFAEQEQRPPPALVRAVPVPGRGDTCTLITASLNGN